MSVCKTYSPTLINKSSHISLQVHRWIVPNNWELWGGSWPRFFAERLIQDSDRPQANMMVMATTVSNPKTWCGVWNWRVYKPITTISKPHHPKDESHKNIPKQAAH